MSNRLFAANCPVTHCAPKRLKRTWGRMLLDVLMLLALAALCGWLWSCVRHAATEPTALVAQQQGYLLAMAPVPLAQGMAMGGMLVALLLMVAWAGRKSAANERAAARRWDAEILKSRRQREARERVWREARRKAKDEGSKMKAERRWTVGPLEALSEPEPEPDDAEAELRWSAVDSHRLAACLTPQEAGTVAVGLEDLRRIVSALAVETCSARDFLLKMERSLDEDDREDLRRLAVASLHQCVGCLSGLMESLQAGKSDATQRVPTEGGVA